MPKSPTPAASFRGDNASPTSHPPKPMADHSASDSSDLSDGDDDRNQFMREAVKLRRSARQPKNITRYTDESLIHNNSRRRVSLSSPPYSPGSAHRPPRPDVFSSAADVGRRTGRSMLSSILRQCEKQDAEEEDLEQMRQNITTDQTDALDTDEAGMKKRALDADEMNRKEAIAYLKYSKPLPFFSANVSPFPPLPRDNDLSDSRSHASVFGLCPLSRMFDIALPHSVCILTHSDYLRDCFTKKPQTITQKIVRRLFYSCVWDPTPVDPLSAGRQPLLDPLIIAIKKQPPSSSTWHKSSVWSLRQVLLVYGVVFDDTGIENENPLETVKEALADDEDDTDIDFSVSVGNNHVCLDDEIRIRRQRSLKSSTEQRICFECNRRRVGQTNTPCVLHSDNDRTRKQHDRKKVIVDLARRNIGRYLVIASALVHRGWDLKRVIDGTEGGETESMDVDTDEDDLIVSTVTMCVRILLSRFGSGLKRETGRVIQSLVQRVSETNWPAIRWRIAQSVISLTSRMNLHVELATYMLPFYCRRCLGLSLDICYLSVQQWCNGPSLDPRPCGGVWDVSAPAGSNTTEVSFRLGDVVDLLERVPEMTKDSDVQWACGLTRLLKQMVTMPTVLKQRTAKDYARLENVVQKMRTCQKRLSFGEEAEVQDMRIGLDTLSRAVQDMCDGDAPRSSPQTKLNLSNSPDFDAGSLKTFCKSFNTLGHMHT